MKILPILFVHGNGDNASVWHSSLWHFESNGYPASHLHTFSLPYPTARDDDATPQPGRSSASEYTQALADKVSEVLRECGAEFGATKLVLIGNSRGGIPIRRYVKFGEGRHTVAKVILGGTPNHGAWASDIHPGNEFNGQGAVLHDLNMADKNGDETTKGVRFLTLRSDHFDKYAQPSGEWLGLGHTPTNVSYDGPALHGAQNLVLAERDHREVSFHPDAFAATYRFITGHAPAHIDIVPEKHIILDGQISSLLITPSGDETSNFPLPDAQLEIYEVAPESGTRIAERHRKIVAADGRWGPFAASPTACYEFVIRAEGYAITHIYRSPFPRSSSVIHLRPARLPSFDARNATRGSMITMTRPRGYFGIGRDTMSLDGIAPPPGLQNGLLDDCPGLSESCLTLAPAAMRCVVGLFNHERIAVQSWPLDEGHLVFAELHY